MLQFPFMADSALFRYTAFSPFGPIIMPALNHLLF
jgi:hypothetical protein